MEIAIHIFSNVLIGLLSSATNCCLKRRALHPNALPTWSVATAGQLGNWANSMFGRQFSAQPS